jgi:hypothetical protein
MTKLLDMLTAYARIRSISLLTQFPSFRNPKYRGGPTSRLLAIVALLPSKPGPEVRRLGSWVGTWKTDTETVTWEWFKGGFSLIGHVENSGPEGKSSELRIVTYDPDAKTYSQYRITSTGPGGTLGRGGHGQRKHLGVASSGRRGVREISEMPFQHR